jgi:hypothetical protein
MRHEIAHYYEPILCPEGSAARDRYRELFGDERSSYQEAIDRHYAEGAPDGWANEFVSAYASMHPWEDWAETFAHYLHIHDTLQSAAAFGVHVDGPSPGAPGQTLASTPPGEPSEVPFEEVLAAWMPLSTVLNAIGRSMGRDDLYPFTLAAPVIAKLEFVHDCLARLRAGPLAGVGAATMPEG